MTREEAKDWNYKNFRSDCINDFIDKIYDHFEAQLKAKDEQIEKLKEPQEQLSYSAMIQFADDFIVANAKNYCFMDEQQKAIIRDFAGHTQSYLKCYPSLWKPKVQQ